MTLTTEQAALRVGVDASTIRRWVMRGWLEPVRRGAKPLRFDENALIECELAHASKVRRSHLTRLSTALDRMVCDLSR